MSNTTIRGMMLVLALGLAVAGCQNTPLGDGDFITDEGAPRDVDRIAAAQASAGAYADATLRPHHFDGASLNSLGRSKLHLMLAHRPATVPLAVYMDLPKSDAEAAQRDAVLAYLQQSGLSGQDVKLVAGPNPATLRPAGAELDNLPKTETTGASQDTGAPTAAGAGQTR